MTILSKSKCGFVRMLIGNDALALNASHTMNGRRHTVLAKFKVVIELNLFAVYVLMLNFNVCFFFNDRTPWTI